MMEIILETAAGLSFGGAPGGGGMLLPAQYLLREAIETLSSHFDLTLIDAEAGVEQVNRRVMRSVSHCCW